MKYIVLIYIIKSKYAANLNNSKFGRTNSRAVAISAGANVANAIFNIPK